MYRITLILILFLLIPDVYIYLVYIRRKTQNVRLRWLHWLPSIAILVSYVYLMYLTGDNPMSNHSQGIGYVAVAALLFISSKTVFLICSVVGVFLHALIRRCPRAPFTAVGILLGSITFGCFIYGSVWGTTRFEVKEVEYKSELLPEGFDGYRIV